MCECVPVQKHLFCDWHSNRTFQHRKVKHAQHQRKHTQFKREENWHQNTVNRTSQHLWKYGTDTPSAVHSKAEAQSSVRFCIHQERLIIKIWFCGDFSYRWARYCRVMMVLLFHGYLRSCSWLLTVGNRIHWGDQKWAWVSQLCPQEHKSV